MAVCVTCAKRPKSYTFQTVDGKKFASPENVQKLRVSIQTSVDGVGNIEKHPRTPHVNVDKIYCLDLRTYFQELVEVPATHGAHSQQH
jgi:hypothetical protein